MIAEAELFAAIQRYGEQLEAGAPDELGPDLINCGRAGDLIALIFAKAAARFAATDAYDRDGSATPIDWIRHQCQMSGSIAADRVRVGEHLPHLPQSAEAMRSGTIGFGHLSLIARTAAAMSAPRAGQPFDESPLLEQALQNSVGKFWHICQHLRHAADPEGVAREQKDAVEARRLRLSTFEDGMVMVGGQLDPLGAATLRTALEPLARPGGADDHRDHERRLADALVELATPRHRAGAGPGEPAAAPAGHDVAGDAARPEGISGGGAGILVAHLRQDRGAPRL